MSVIVGVESTVRPYASVIAADTMAVNSLMSLLLPRLAGLIGHMKSGESGDEVLLKYIGRGIPISTHHKIYVSPNQDSVLAYTGHADELFEDIKGFLLEGLAYFKRTEAYQRLEIITDFGYDRDWRQEPRGSALSQETQDRLSKEYSDKFSLAERLLLGYVPEIPRIAAIKNRNHLQYGYDSNADSDFFDRPRWDPLEGAYLFSTMITPENVANLSNRHPDLEESLDIDGGRPLVFPIRAWGVSRRNRPFSAFGLGREAALEYICKELDLNFEDGDGGSFEDLDELEITKRKAISLARGAVKYANKKHALCDGLDYVVLTSNGVEEHFSDEEKSGSIDMEKAIGDNIIMLNGELEQLTTVKKLLAERAQE